MKKKLTFATLLILCVALATFLPVAQVTTTTASLRVYKSSEGNFVVENDKLKIIVEELSQTHHRLLCIEQNGRQTVFEIIVANSEVVLLVNGTETLRFPVKENSLASPVSSESVTIQANVYYWWDDLYFVGTGQYIKYPHPDRDYYGISPFSNWMGTGTKLYHYQIDQTTSRTLNSGGPALIGAAIGAIIGTIIAPPYGTIIGAIAGAVIAMYLTQITGGFLDEWDCIWWWISRAWVQWFADNAGWLAALYLISPALAIAYAASAFVSCGYLRVSSVTFYDAVGAGYPNPPPNIPSTPSGPTSGTGCPNKCKSYTYSTSTTDPDGDDVRYQFDWGDGTTTWTGWYASGATASASHAWYAGTYNVKVRAQDEHGVIGAVWSSSLTVTMSHC